MDADTERFVELTHDIVQSEHLKLFARFNRLLLDALIEIGFNRKEAFRILKGVKLSFSDKEIATNTLRELCDGDGSYFRTVAQAVVQSRNFYVEEGFSEDEATELNADARIMIER